MGGRAHIREGMRERLAKKGRGSGKKIGRGSSSVGQEEYTGGRRGSGPRTRRGSSSVKE